ncbi:MAG TPA: hypothetical protein VE999_16220 [Gemmataceae bacterium]|nr:hypothetical protein [Gemmataceae bacterium]
MLDEATEAELELSFYDYQQGRFIASNGLTNEPYFFSASLVRKGGKQGYLVGPEVTRSLRHRALVGIASRDGPLGDIPSDVRAYRTVGHGATIDIRVPEPIAVTRPSLGTGSDRGTGAEADAVASVGKDRAGMGETSELAATKSEPESGPEEKAQRTRRLAFATGFLALLLIIAAPFGLAKLDWYGFVVSVSGPLEFSENPRKSIAETVTFTPEYTTVEIRRAFWARPFEGWWISEKPPAEIEMDSATSWLSKDDQSRGDKIIMALRPKAPASTSATRTVHSQLTFRNKDTGAVFDRRDVRLRLAEPVGNLSLGGSDPVVFVGFRGGSFNPELTQIALSATGNDVRWSAQDIPSWIALTGGPTGKLNKGSSVTLTLTPRAANLAPGTYDARLGFRDEETNIAAHKSVRLVVMDPAYECDRRSAFRFDPDRPRTGPFLADPAQLSADDLELATRACAAAFQGDSSAAGRRFIAEMGRAFAIRAVHLARSGADTEAHSAMSNAMRLWQEAATKGSTSAMSLLGSYWAGLYDNEIDPPPAGKCRSGPAKFSFTVPDLRMAMDYWERAAKANPPSVEGMSDYGKLLVAAPDFCPPRPDLQNIQEGISWLKRAVDRGNVEAAAFLGELYYRGRAPSSTATNDSFPKDVDEGSRWLAIACKGGDIRAKDFVNRMISSTKEMDQARRPPGC